MSVLNGATLSRRRLIAAAFAIWIVGSDCSVPAARGEEIGMSSIEERGKGLRESVLGTDRNLQSSGELDKTRGNGFDISETVHKFIPEGTSMADALQILRAAGYRIYPKVPEIGDPTHFVARGILVLQKKFGYERTAEVNLFPKDPKDTSHSSVKRLSGRIVARSL